MTILEEFLDAGLLSEVGDGDARYEHTKQAATALGGELAGQPAALIPTILIALDPKAAITDPAFDAPSRHLRDTWPTYKHAFTSGTPQRLLRAIMLQGLAEVGDLDARHAAIIYLAGQTYRPYAPLGAEADVCDRMLLNLGQKAEEEAQRAWSKPSETDPILSPSFESKLAAIQPLAVDTEQLTQSMIAAAGPNAQGGVALKDANPYWPNSAQHWSWEFAPRAAGGVADAINAMGTALNKQAVQQNASQVKNFNELSGHMLGMLQQATQAARQHSSAMELKTRVLWWMEALYSSSLLCSYRELQSEVGIAVMALDLHDLTPVPQPASVGYVLAEAVRRANSSMDGMTISRFLGGLAEAESSAILKRFIPAAAELALGRTSLIALAEQAIYGHPVPEADLRARLGVDPHTPVAASALALWLFRDLQARALVSEIGSGI